MKTKRVSLPQLVKRADKEFSRYVRLRDCEYIDGQWVGECITCGRRLVVVDASGHWNAGSNLGHFVGRACKRLRWDEYNCNLQCAHCNAWRDKIDMLDAYKKGVDDKYGTGTWKRLVKEGKETHKPTREELDQVIHDSKEYCNYTLNHLI